MDRPSSLEGEDGSLGPHGDNHTPLSGCTTFGCCGRKNGDQNVKTYQRRQPGRPLPSQPLSSENKPDESSDQNLLGIGNIKISQVVGQFRCLI